MDEQFCKMMFGISSMPKIDLSLSEISIQAQKVSGKLSISGVQPKLSVKLDKESNLLIPVEREGEYILKPQTLTFENLSENEQCCMDIANRLGIDVPMHCLIELKDKSLAYIVKRFDRNNGEKIHQEDFSQILEQKDKYKGSVEQIGKRIKDISTSVGEDLLALFERVVFFFLIGNGDAHLKNYTFVYYEDGKQKRLSPAYDIVSSKLVIEGEEDSALTINGKKNKLQRSDFDTFADYLEVPSDKSYGKFRDKLGIIEDLISASKIDKNKQVQFLDIVKDRYCRIYISG